MDPSEHEVILPAGPDDYQRCARLFGVSVHNPTPTTEHPLRTVREERGLSRAKTTRRAGIDKGLLSRFEHGQQALSVEALTRLARVLGQHELAATLAYWTGERP
jgi:DNA-binding transcriptional regulator YiaG